MTECSNCGEEFTPPMRGSRPCWMTKACSPKCKKEARAARHRQASYAVKRRAYRAKRRSTDPSAEYQSLKLRRPWKAAYNSKRGIAKARGIPFSLSYEWFKKRYQAGCEITGLAFSMGEGKLWPFSPSVDRIDQEKGYTPRNSRLVLYGVNALRGTGNDDDMYKIAEAIIKRRT